VTALIAASGNVEWMCLPRMDSPSVFSAILDRGAGWFRLGPADVTVPAGRRYLPGTMVLETTWDTPAGWAVVRDVLLVRPWRPETRRSKTHRRVPSDHRADRVLLRTVRCLDGAIDFVLECEPAFDYGRQRGTWRHTSDGYGQAEAVTGDTPQLRLTTDLKLGFEGPRAIARHRLHEGEEVFCALSWGDGSPPESFAEAHQRLADTADFWHGWLGRGRFPDHPWRKYLQRSALTLKGLIYAPTGALLAAATTSLPETPGGDRNYDYRYSWLRDSTFMLWALYTLGLDREADDFFYFLFDQAGQDADLQIMYGIGGERELTEQTLDHLSGYDGARPVRIGNGAWDQRQHDVWGVLLDSVYLHARSRDRRLGVRGWPVLVRQVEAALAHWREPDQGLWEVRGPAQHFTASKVLCWVAADRGAKLAVLRGDDEHAIAWRKAADEIHADVCANGTDDRGVFCQHYDTTALDASALLIPLLGFLPPDDERVHATVLAIADELTEDELVLRYRVEETDDGFTGEEGTFTICSFWLVSALTEIGELDRARALCEKLLSYASPLLLYAEEIDAYSGRHLGNFPQAFSHLALINALIHLIDADERLSAEAAISSSLDPIAGTPVPDGGNQPVP
jgi:GH15 family glucan-1,4-alpha-glucosidase